MERIALYNDANIVKLSANNYVVNKAKQLNFVVENGQYINILINDIEENALINIDMQEGSNLRISFLSTKAFSTLKFVCNCHRDSAFVGYFADFSENKNYADITVNLLEPGSTSEWHLASLASKQDNKQFDVSVFHNAPNTYAKMDNYGVCKDTAKLVFSGISSIIKGSRSCKTHQNAKIMVFDEESWAAAKPILKIDENDIEASHAAIVGKINDDHLFYLTSRGLTEAEAKELITFGYLKPILNGFDDESIKEEINSLIEGRM